MKERFISAIVALLITIPLLLLGGVYFKVLAIILGLLSIRELLNTRKNLPTIIKYITYFLFLIFALDGILYINNSIYINMNDIILYIFTLFLPIIVYHNNKKYSIDDVLFIFGSLILLSLVFNYFIFIRNEGLMLTIYLLLIPIITDTFAYLGGRKLGRNKLVPSISPKKSVEGLIIGTFFGVLLPTAFYYLCVNSSTNIVILLLVTLFLSFIGQLGDLVFSSIKRNYKIKDFSNIMPGHGGILDRLDSSIFVILGYIVIRTFL